MPHGPIHDHDRIAAMAGVCCPQHIIAERLGCSARTVRRVLKERDIEYEPSTLIGTEEEAGLYVCYENLGLTPGKIAYSFGLSRQGVIIAMRLYRHYKKESRRLDGMLLEAWQDRATAPAPSS